MERKQEDLEGHTARPFTSPASLETGAQRGGSRTVSSSATVAASGGVHSVIARRSPIRRPATSHQGPERSAVSDFGLASPLLPRFNTVRPSTVRPGGSPVGRAGRQTLLTDTLATPKRQRKKMLRSKDSFAFVGGKKGPAFTLTSPSRDGLGHEDEEDGRTRTRTFSSSLDFIIDRKHSAACMPTGALERRAAGEEQSKIGAEPSEHAHTLFDAFNKYEIQSPAVAKQARQKRIDVAMQRSRDARDKKKKTKATFEQKGRDTLLEDQQRISANIPEIHRTKSTVRAIVVRYCHCCPLSASRLTANVSSNPPSSRTTWTPIKLAR